VRAADDAAAERSKVSSPSSGKRREKRKRHALSNSPFPYSLLSCTAAAPLPAGPGDREDDERKPVRRVTPVILAAAFLLALDIVGALAERPLGFPYPALSVVSFLVYLAVGLMAAWRANFAAGVVSAAIVGFLDATLGPLFAWLIGHGPLGSVTEPRVFAYSITVVTAIAAAAGLVGAAMASWLERRRGTRPVLGSKS
jgi:hypothetical protein